MSVDDDPWNYRFILIVVVSYIFMKPLKANMKPKNHPNWNPENHLNQPSTDPWLTWNSSCSFFQGLLQMFVFFWGGRKWANNLDWVAKNVIFFGVDCNIWFEAIINLLIVFFFQVDGFIISLFVGHNFYEKKQGKNAFIPKFLMGFSMKNWPENSVFLMAIFMGRLESPFECSWCEKTVCDFFWVRKRKSEHIFGRHQTWRADDFW